MVAATVAATDLMDCDGLSPGLRVNAREATANVFVWNESFEQVMAATSEALRQCIDVHVQQQE